MFIGWLIESRRELWGDRGPHFFLGEPTDSVVGTYCQEYSAIREIVEVAEYVKCPTCSGRYLMESDVRMTGPEATLGEEAYRKVFNGSVQEKVDLVVQTRAIKEMDDEELTKFIYEMEEFVKKSRIVSQAARINLEDRKLRYTEEQKARLKELDKTYKPKPRTPENEEKQPRKAKAPEEKLPADPIEKKIITLMKVMQFSREEAIEYLKGMKLIPADWTASK